MPAKSADELGLLTHTWSLSLEEQFYLLWPLALVGLLAASRKRPASWRIAVVLLGAGAAGLERILLVGHAPLLRVLDGLDTNADLLLFGCAAGLAVAAGARVDRRRPRLALQGASLVATAFLAVASTQVLITDTHFIRMGGFTLVGIATALIILQLVLAPFRPMARLLESRPLVFTGRISYGLYLWHVPVFLAVSLTWLHGRVLIAAGHMAIAFAVAIASYRWIETPFLRMKRRLSVVDPDRTPPVELDDREPERDLLAVRPAGTPAPVTSVPPAP